MKLKEEFIKGFVRSLGIAAGLAVIAGVVGLFADSLHVFTSGQAVSAAQINANFNKLPPIGSIQAWHKSLSGTPSLPDGWVQCDGQTISDIESPYNGQAVPNLNAARPDPAGGSAGTYSRGVFLRGHTTSGLFQDDQIQGHFHGLINNTGVWRGVGGAGAVPGGAGDATFTLSVTAPTTDGTNGTPRTGSESRPVNMSVVYIIRIK